MAHCRLPHARPDHGLIYSKENYFPGIKRIPTRYHFLRRTHHYGSHTCPAVAHARRHQIHNPKNRNPHRQPAVQMKKTILILGGGFGGVYTAVYLEKLMSREERASHEIVIVSRDNYIVFQPLLPEVTVFSSGNRFLCKRTWFDSQKFLSSTAPLQAGSVTVGSDHREREYPIVRQGAVRVQAAGPRRGAGQDAGDHDLRTRGRTDARRSAAAGHQTLRAGFRAIPARRFQCGAGVAGGRVGRPHWPCAGGPVPRPHQASPGEGMDRDSYF
jgi:hypothetical protein